MKKQILLSALMVVAHLNLLLSQSTAPAPYCAADFDDSPPFASDVPDAIDSVSFGTLLNPSNAQYAFPHYVFYNNLPVSNFIKGNAYTLTVTFDVHGSAGYGVWIDYNQDNVFDDAEKVAGSTGTGFLSLSMYPAHTPVTKTITIPISALTGQTRMRVRIVEDDSYTGAHGASILACNTSTSSADVMDWGETEDYTINIIASPVGINELSRVDAITISPNPATTSILLDQNLPGNLVYEIADLTGQVVQAGAIDAPGKTIKVSALAEGIYVLKLYNSAGYFGQQKFVKLSE